MSDPGDGTERPRLTVGTKVEVRTGFDGSWAPGFDVEVVTDRGYRVRRRSDDELLPTEFRASAVRRERKSSMWWV